MVVGSPRIIAEWEECNSCAHNECYWVRAEYLNWRVSGGNLPALITTSPVGTPAGTAGVLGAAGTTVLFGGKDYLDDNRSGFRIGAGAWLTADKRLGIEASFFYLGTSDKSHTEASDGGAIIASSPFVNALTGDQTRVLISFPGLVGGSTAVKYSSDRIHGFDALLRWQFWQCDNWRVDGLVGYRQVSFDESLTIQKTLVPNPAGVAVIPGTTILCNDGWKTENCFNGFTIGANIEKCCDSWTFVARPRISIGSMSSKVTRDGVTVISTPGVSTLTFPGGTYNLSSNIGDLTESKCTILPELDLQVSHKLGEHCRLFAGYSVMYLAQIARPGDQIDPRVNPTLIPPPVPVAGPLLPSAFVGRSDAWLHGVSLGFEYRY
jgi:hypothetical protein